ncbi:MAG: hypothetical protein UW74_C0017G0003 [Candidatus Giovannonibacteria bacterium GW2011_GWC2_44_8]|uniref:Uncharacterized protein n=1 Tax=Candidatus Giovannonibacteria bacterium GW2011_GWC2_44_8 TaxID=1618657 RepID=A0A0G1N3F7_9BACT|nr:MAG: hypothetical protein UW74_C0017G0003 [Candidatus Giovannonibacteria bacterium GW2011_GWC2_44_8]
MKTLIIIALTIVIISLLGVSLGDIQKNTKLKENFDIVWNFIYPWARIGWDKAQEYILVPLLKAAKDIRG